MNFHSEEESNQRGVKILALGKSSEKMEISAALKSS
jgi:hypothetical protein